jgi:hypothetical protein
MIKRICAAFILTSLALALIAHADGEKPKLKGTSCHGTFQKFRCGYIGEVTITEIYEKGWRVIAVVEDSHFVNLIIEEQGT